MFNKTDKGKITISRRIAENRNLYMVFPYFLLKLYKLQMWGRVSYSINKLQSPPHLYVNFFNISLDLSRIINTYD
nr:hypothetical protein BACY1_15970 [Tenacibaculum mesophilum]